jgi:hypothetical protein
MAKRKGVDLKSRGMEWTKKPSSDEWDMSDYMKVKANLEKLEDAHE